MKRCGRKNIITSRSLMLTIISNNPGISFGRIMKAANVGNGTASYHLYRLECSGKIVSVPCGRHRLFWTARFKGMRDRRQLPPVCRSIVKVLRKGNSANSANTVGAIARKLDISHQRVSYNMRILETKGMARRLRAGRKTLCILTEN